ncbi:MAG: hypothetical protein ABWZ42_11675 [Ilumatobacteraceae bacterium]
MGGSAGTSRPRPWHAGSTDVGRPRHRIAGILGTGFVLATFVAGTSVVAAGCGSDDPDDPPESVSTDAVLTALVDWAVGSEATPDTTDDEPPVVYITALNGDTIDAAVQASVVAATTDDATVRFADDRSEAIDHQTEDQHVHDDGVLLVVGELPADAPPVEMTVERYRTVDDASVFVVTLATDGDGASVTGATVE